MLIPVPSQQRAENRAFLKGLARAFGGAIVFSLPMLMTMEMWSLAFYVQPYKLALLLLLVVPLLIGLSHFIGFEDTFDWKDDVVDAFVAYCVGVVATAPLLFVFGVITAENSAADVVGTVALQAIPASIGALLAQSQFGSDESKALRRKVRADTYGGEVFFMAAGAVFLSLNVAPTEEMVLIAYKMTPWHTLALAVASLILMHAFVYSLEFSGQSNLPHGGPLRAFLRFTVVGYAICLVISAYMLWTFGRIEGSVEQSIMATVVLAFPAAIGAAAARLIL